MSRGVYRNGLRAGLHCFVQGCLMRVRCRCTAHTQLHPAPQLCGPARLAPEAAAAVAAMAQQLMPTGHVSDPSRGGQLPAAPRALLLGAAAAAVTEAAGHTAQMRQAPVPHTLAEPALAPAPADPTRREVAWLDLGWALQ